MRWKHKPVTDSANPYLTEVHQCLPRLLASFDRDPLSPTRGLGDRLFWGWKTHDYANATPQGAVNGLARLVVENLLPPQVSKASAIARINEMILATRTITARDGSLVEAFPNEKSFCVTALIALDILSAADHLKDHVEPQTLAGWRQTAAPLIEFIIKHDETHAIISNHLATAVAALTRWTGPGAAQAETRARQLLDVILKNQSREGWYSEYGSVDPGYETLGLYYLADTHLRRPDLGLAESLRRSLAFLVHFAHPDGSFGGLYGARNTRFIVPGGIEALAPSIPEAAALAKFARKSVSGRRIVTLATFDDPNLAPNFNAYCWAAAQACKTRDLTAATHLPCERKEPFRTHFTAAQIVIDNGPDHYTIVAPAKGGVVVHSLKDGSTPLVNAGACCRVGDHIYTTQALRPGNVCQFDGDRLTVTAPFIAAIAERPTPLKFLILRMLSVTAFRFRPFTEWIKRLLVRRLVTGQKPFDVFNTRTIKLGRNIKIVDEISAPDRVERLDPGRPFTAIHMASAGYWQAGDDET